MVMEIVVTVRSVTDAGHAILAEGTDIHARPAFLDLVGANAQQRGRHPAQPRHHFGHDRRVGGDGESPGGKRAGVTFEGRHVPVQFLRVCLGVGPSPEAAQLLGLVEHQPYRAPWAQIQRQQQPRRAHGDGAASPVVVGAGAGVPRVEVSAQQDDLIRQLAPADIGHDVG